MSRYRSNNYFKFGTCDTIDDVTGLKVKLSATSRRWDGIQTTSENYEPRQPQDFPVTPRPQRTFTDARGELPEEDVVPFVFDGSFGL